MFTLRQNRCSRSPRISVHVRQNNQYAFEIGKTEVTQGLWKAIMVENPSKFSQCGDDCPVENVSWNDAIRFIKRLNKKTGKEYRLASEAEWEYACRAGGNDEFCGGNEAGKLAWYKSNSGDETSSVAGKLPNAWGLYDMSGNVSEWVQDCYQESFQGAPADGEAWEAGNCSNRIIRGGSCNHEPRPASKPLLVASKRLFNGIDAKFSTIGFRLARTLQ